MEKIKRERQTNLRLTSFSDVTDSKHEVRLLNLEKGGRTRCHIKLVTFTKKGKKFLGSQLCHLCVQGKYLVQNFIEKCREFKEKLSCETGNTWKDERMVEHFLDESQTVFNFNGGRQFWIVSFLFSPRINLSGEAGCTNPGDLSFCLRTDGLDMFRVNCRERGQNSKRGKAPLLVLFNEKEQT